MDLVDPLRGVRLYSPQPSKNPISIDATPSQSHNYYQQQQSALDFLEPQQYQLQCNSLHQSLSTHQLHSPKQSDFPALTPTTKETLKRKCVSLENVQPLLDSIEHVWAVNVTNKKQKQLSESFLRNTICDSLSDPNLHQKAYSTPNDLDRPGNVRRSLSSWIAYCPSNTLTPNSPNKDVQMDFSL